MRGIRGGRGPRRSRRFAFGEFGLERRQLLSYAPTVAAYQVNQVAEGGQYGAQTTTGPDGVTTIVWTDFGLDGDGNGVYARRIDATGRPLGSQFRVNANTVGNQGAATVGSDAQGNVLVLWQDDQGGTSFFVQRFDPQGRKLGENTLLPGTAGIINYFSLRVLPDGGFIVLGNDVGAWGTAAYRRYTAAGELAASSTLPLDRPGWSFQTFSGELPSAMAGNNLVVTWLEIRTQSIPDVGTRYDGRVWARRIDANGQAVGPDVLVVSKEAETDYQVAQNLKPAVTGLADGGFLAAWYAYSPGGSAFVGRRFDASATPQDRLITFSPTSSASYGHGDTVTLKQLSDGNILAAAVQETAFEADTSDFRVFNPEGDPLTPRISMPSVTAYYLGNVRIAPTGGSSFVIAWGDQANPPYNGEIYAQAFADVSTIGFTTSAIRVGESSGLATLTVARDGSAAAAASVRYATLSESASGGLDYTASSGVATFAAGQSTASITIPILRDREVEGDETFLVTLSDPIGVAFGDTLALRVTIVDDPDGTGGPTLPNVYLDRGADGLWAWIQGVGSQQLSAWDPEGLAVAADGTLYVDFGLRGLWTRTGADLVQINSADPEGLSAAPDGSLYVDYGPYGLWRRDAAGLAQLNVANPEGFAASADGTLYVDFGPYGLWRRDAQGIVQINAADPENLAVAPNGILYVDFGPYGFWRRDAAGIAQVNPANPEALVAAADGSVFVDFGPYGLWRWSNGFVQLNAADPEALAAAPDGSLYIDFGAYGLWSWKAGGFSQINRANPDGFDVARDGFIYIDFGPFGVWRRGPSGLFEMIDPIDSQRLEG
ncbi:Calx-beta domain-containing protein [Paludisphaera mucosa]|uniref:Calx-beta domain-containing protein n=1 Tax=Paludisphaera mucosa TaxID=3030827 RepID=A0ABT6FIM2_9BACT|nr:Calx-beta domain-containing protein [Paludisphaera mucosa]MDG3007422.1 Calx-beta domain-containing protein [Paludisphaera mucosa]